jgi:two-component system, response regulator PdtaR
MNQTSPSRRRALIVEDEIMIALDLEDAMADLGFEVCALVPSDRRARLVAMRDQPDVVLVDVCLEGGREGIETARWLREVCGASIVFVTGCNDGDTVKRIEERVPGAPVVAKPVYREQLASAIASAALLATLAPASGASAGHRPN